MARLSRRRGTKRARVAAARRSHAALVGVRRDRGETTTPSRAATGEYHPSLLPPRGGQPTASSQQSRVRPARRRRPNPPPPSSLPTRPSTDHQTPAAPAVPRRHPPSPPPPQLQRGRQRWMTDRGRRGSRHTERESAQRQVHIRRRGPVKVPRPSVHPTPPPRPPALQAMADGSGSGGGGGDGGRVGGGGGDGASTACGRGTTRQVNRQRLASRGVGLARARRHGQQRPRARPTPAAAVGDGHPSRRRVCRRGIDTPATGREGGVPPGRLSSRAWTLVDGVGGDGVAARRGGSGAPPAPAPPPTTPVSFRSASPLRRRRDRPPAAASAPAPPHPDQAGGRARTPDARRHHSQTAPGRAHQHSSQTPSGPLGLNRHEWRGAPEPAVFPVGGHAAAPQIRLSPSGDCARPSAGAKDMVMAGGRERQASLAAGQICSSAVCWGCGVGDVQNGPHPRRVRCMWWASSGAGRPSAQGWRQGGCRRRE